jgi:Kef-type K+ transport system membrane component KefB
MSATELLIALVVIFVAAKIFGEIAERLGQPAVLGEMVGGIVVGVSGLHLLDAHEPMIHLLSELGVVLLLFLIGLETDLKKLISVGPASAAVAVVGVALPFGLGWAVGAYLGYPTTVSAFLGAALTATSVGITARVLSDLGHLKATESQVILGAAVIDDVLGLVFLSVLSAVAAGKSMSVLRVGRELAVAFGFVAAAIILGSLLAPWLMKMIAKLRVTKALFFASIVFAFGLAYLASVAGSAMIVGAFAAGLVIARTDRGKQLEHEVHDVAQFFIPIFFVSVGAAVDLKTLNPFDPATRPFLLVGIALTVVAIIGKLAAGFAAFGQPLRKLVIGVGMIPRGEVGLIFAGMGLASGLLSSGLYSSVALMVMATTFITPPILRVMLPKQPSDEGSVLSELMGETMSDRTDDQEGPPQVEPAPE